MADTTAVESVPAPDSGPERGFFQHLGGLFFSPRQEFPSILKRPRFWIPALALMAVNIAFTGVWLSKVDAVEFMRTQIEESPRADRLTPEQKERAIEQQAKMFPIFAWFVPVVFIPLLIVVVGSLCFFLFRFFYGSDLTFGQSLSVTAWSYLVVSLVQVPLMLLVMALKGEWSIDPNMALQANLSILLDKATAAKPLWSLFASLDLFSFWTIFLLATGYAVASRRPTSSAVAGIVGLWAIYVLGKVALSAIF